MVKESEEVSEGCCTQLTWEGSDPGHPIYVTDKLSSTDKISTEISCRLLKGMNVQCILSEAGFNYEKILLASR